MELAAALRAAGCDLLLILAESSRDPDLAPFVGPVHLGRSLLVASEEGPPRLGLFTDMEREEAARTSCVVLSPRDLRMPETLRKGASGSGLWAASVAAALDAVGRPPGRIALAGRSPAGVVVAVIRLLEERGWVFTAGNELVRRLRRRKGGAQRAAVRRAAEGTAAALRAVARTLAATAPDAAGALWIGGERLRTGHLREAVGRALVPWCLEQPEGSIVTAGRDAGVPHTQGDSARELKAGEALVVDLFPRGELFADCTRTFCVGEAPAPLREAHALVVEVLRRAQQDAAPGVSGWDLQVAACARFHDAGHATPIHDEGSRQGYVHGLGHGVGYELHELPSFARGAGEEGTLAEGDVFTLEPGLYEPDAGWGVRVENLLLMGARRAETLTPLPYDLDPRAWETI